MARTARATSSIGIYHIMMRGINHQNIFRDDEDKEKFLYLLQKILNRQTCQSGKIAGEYEVYAYALMGNHFHILIKVVSGLLGDFVKALASSYALYFNSKYERDGHLFKERFKSEPCNTDEYFFILLRYIHQNPLKAGFSKDLMLYKYTSWPEYADPYNYSFRICRTDLVLAKTTIETLTALVYEMLPENIECIEFNKAFGKISDELVVKFLCERFGISSLEEARKLKRADIKPIVVKLLEYGAGICQLERLLCVSKSTVSRIRKLTLEAKNETK